jgi:excisionase family DNA binding protein
MVKRFTIDGVPMDADSEKPLSPAEVAALFRVDSRTVTRWAREGRLGSFKTIGGHRRFRRPEVMAFLNAGTTERSS